MTSRVFNWDLQHSNRRGTWSYYAKHLLYDIHCHDSYHSVTPCDISYAKEAFKAIDEADWDRNRYSSDKLRYYNLYKYSKDTEEYITYNIKKYRRSLFAQFRCGILPIQIEIGRFRGLSLCDRICPVCEEGVEDEIHFLCQCSCYSAPRNNLFAKAVNLDPLFMSLDVIDQFVFLMSNMQRDVIRYLVTAVQHRISLLTR